MHPIITQYEADLLIEERLRVAAQRRRTSGGSPTAARRGPSLRRGRLRGWFRRWRARPAHAVVPLVAPPRLASASRTRTTASCDAG